MVKTDECVRLLGEARKVLERYMYDGIVLRDDVAEVCMKLDDVLRAHEAPKQIVRAQDLDRGWRKAQGAAPKLRACPNWA